MIETAILTTLALALAALHIRIEHRITKLEGDIKAVCNKIDYLLPPK